MELKTAVPALSALAHEGRLSIFRLLVRAGDDGLAAGDIARQTGTAPNTLSSNLAILTQAGLVEPRRQGRSIIYSCRFEHMAALLDYLAADCCAGAPEVCGPLSQALAKACRPPPALAL